MVVAFVVDEMYIGVNGLDMHQAVAPVEVGIMRYYECYYPLPEAVHIAFFTKHINTEGKFISDEGLDKSAELMLAELVKWTNALAPLRGK